jgi:enamine deaminase RidA (YjgF/YER057c/UK114 family)
MENKVDRILILPSTGENLDTQLINILQQVKSQLEKKNGHILQLSFFIHVNNNSEYLDRIKLISSTVYNAFRVRPSTSIIAQSPANGHQISLELILLLEKSVDATIVYKKEQNIAYTLVTSPDATELYAGGISAMNFTSDFTEQVNRSYNLMKLILNREGMTFANIVRQWNYVEGILKICYCNDEHIQHYQVLNDIRSKYYAEADFRNGYPAATGIGTDAGGLLLECYAIKASHPIDIIPIKNPKQVDAYHYSEQVLVGDSLEKHHKKTTPKFERAKYSHVNSVRTIYISGTASIQSEKTLGENNIRKQTEVTLENIANLLTQSNLRNAGVQKISDTIEYTFIRIYLKTRSDLDLVKDICDKFYKNVPVHYLIADICRDNLLLEIEGVAVLG